MRIIPPAKPTTLEAAFCAPVITPIIAIPAVGLFPDLLADGGYYILALPFVFFLSLVFGYLGMFFICLPTALVLSALKRLNALNLCLITSVLGATAWTLFRSDPEQDWFNSAAVGLLCSLGVSALFCYISGITIRSSRARFAVSALAL